MLCLFGIRRAFVPPPRVHRAEAGPDDVYVVRYRGARWRFLAGIEVRRYAYTAPPRAQLTGRIEDARGRLIHWRKFARLAGAAVELEAALLILRGDLQARGIEVIEGAGW